MSSKASLDYHCSVSEFPRRGTGEQKWPVLAPARGKRKTSLPCIKIKEVLVALSRMFNKWTPVLGLLTSTRAAVKVVTRSFEGKKKKKKKKEMKRK